MLSKFIANNGYGNISHRANILATTSALLSLSKERLMHDAINLKTPSKFSTKKIYNIQQRNLPNFLANVLLEPLEYEHDCYVVQTNNKISKILSRYEFSTCPNSTISPSYVLACVLQSLYGDINYPFNVNQLKYAHLVIQNVLRDLAGIKVVERNMSSDTHHNYAAVNTDFNLKETYIESEEDELKSLLIQDIEESHLSDFELFTLPPEKIPKEIIYIGKVDEAQILMNTFPNIHINFLTTIPYAFLDLTALQQSLGYEVCSDEINLKYCVDNHSNYTTLFFGLGSYFTQAPLFPYCSGRVIIEGDNLLKIDYNPRLFKFNANHANLNNFLLQAKIYENNQYPHYISNQKTIFNMIQDLESEFIVSHKLKI